jgi:hypothetical protein
MADVAKERRKQVLENVVAGNKSTLLTGTSMWQEGSYTVIMAHTLQKRHVIAAQGTV